MAEEQISFDIYQPFGPSVLKTKLPQIYVDALNKQSDDVLNDEEKSKERDWSHNLAGNVKKEISIDHMAIKGLPEFLATISQEYTKRVLPEYLPEGTKLRFVSGQSVSGRVILTRCIYMIQTCRLFVS